ncbi:unnamed protein product, partial [Ostreobium quekettii]
TSQVSIPPELKHLAAQLDPIRRKKIDLIRLLPQVVDALDLEALLAVLDMYGPDGAVNAHRAVWLLRNIGGEPWEEDRLEDYLAHTRGRVDEHDLLSAMGVFDR